MATQSAIPPNPTDVKPHNPAAEVSLPASDVQQSASAEAPEQNTTTSVFVNSEPMREDQVQNAIKFLSHPKVRGSPVIYRRSFLEKKGLTKEEIDEAFRRVPDPTPTVQAASINQDGQVKSSANVQPQAQTQVLQPAAVAPPGTISSVGTLTRSRFHWYHAIIAVGVLAVSGAGTAVLVKNALIPRLKSWIRKVVLEEENELTTKINAKPSLAEEAAAAAKAAAAAAADVARASQEMLNSKTEEKRYFEEFMNLLGVQVREMKSMSNSIQKLEGQANNTGRISFVDQEDHKLSATSSKQPYTNGKADIDLRSVRSSSPPQSTEPPHPKSYMDIMAMVQRGEKPSNIREINDQPPNPNQQPSNPRLVPRAKPWEISQGQNSSSQLLQPQANGNGFGSKVQDSGINYEIDADNSVPWWQRKNMKISEMDNEDELKNGPYEARANEQQPVQRTWVPPQPPPVTMPEAAEAIRRPKPQIVQKEQSGDNSRLTDETDELQRITKIAESGGAVEINGEGSGLHSGEIQEEQEQSIEVN